jgi:hypothetical protein
MTIGSRKRRQEVNPGLQLVLQALPPEKQAPHTRHRFLQKPLQRSGGGPDQRVAGVQEIQPLIVVGLLTVRG